MGVVGLSSGVFVEGLEVYCSPGFAIFLRTDNFSMASCDGFAYGDFLYDSEADVLVQACLDVFQPV